MKSSRALVALSCLALVLGLTHVAPATAAQRFRDVPASHVFATEIAWLADQGITTGYADGTFKPGAPVLREQMAAFLHRFAGSPNVTYALTPFSDVATSHAFVRPISWMNSTRITTGYDGGRAGLLFKGTDPVLREQMAAFLYRAAGSPEVGPLPVASPFTDVSTSHNFYRQIVWLAGTGITTGYTNGDGTRSFAPSQPVLREQMAAFLYRFDDLLERETVPGTSLVSVLPDGTVDRGSSTASRVTDDGEYVAFVSTTPFYDFDEDFGFAPDVFVKERSTGQLFQAPDAVSPGSPFAGLTFHRVEQPVISDDASTVLLRGTSGDPEVFGDQQVWATIWDTGSDTLDVLPAGADTQAYDLTADGREVVFASRRDPVTGAELAGPRLFVWDRETGAVSTLLTSPTGGQPIDGVLELTISGDGRYVAFTSDSGSVVADDAPALAKVYLLDREGAGPSAVRRVSLSAPDPATIYDHSISVADDGSVVYVSQTPAPEIGDLSVSHDVRLWDSQTGSTALVSHDAEGQEGNNWSNEARLSADGQSVVFKTRASDVSGASVPQVILVWDRSSDVFQVIDQDYWGGPGNGWSTMPDISGDGSTVVYSSDATDLVPFNLIGHQDVYAWDRPEGD